MLQMQLLLYVFKALLFIMGDPGLEEDRVHSELCVEQRRVAIHLAEEVYAAVSLVEMFLLHTECFLGSLDNEMSTSKSPADKDMHSVVSS